MALNIDRRIIQQISSLEFIAKQAVEGFITGLHRSPYHGFSVEFAEHRLYNSGESTRHIDWKLFARTERLFVKRYEEETNLRCHIVIDHSGSMYFPKEVKVGGDQMNKLKFSVYGAAALIEMLKRQRDAVGLALFAENVDVYTASKSSHAHQSMLYDHLETLLQSLEDDRVKERTMAVEALHELAERIHQRSLVIIFSDMMDNSAQRQELFSALQHLRHNKHEVILFHTVDKRFELDFDFEQRPYTFSDLETGEEVKVNAGDIKEYYTKQIASFRNSLKIKCGQSQIDYVQADVNEGVNQVLLEYLVKRQKLF